MYFPPTSEIGVTLATTAAATPDEAAAIATAIERFVHDHTPLPHHGLAHGPDPWTRAAMLEGVARDSSLGTLRGAHPWINT